MIALVVSLLLIQQPEPAAVDCTPRITNETINIDYRVLTDRSYGADSSIAVQTEDALAELHAGAAAEARTVRITIRNARGQFSLLRRNPACKLKHRDRGGWR